MTTLIQSSGGTLRQHSRDAEAAIISRNSADLDAGSPPRFSRIACGTSATEPYEKLEIDPEDVSGHERIKHMRAKASNIIDVYVGARLRMRRAMVGMSQTKLGELIGVTFQQIQKYEKGSNRISATRLQHTARVLEVSPGYFFEGAPTHAAEPGFAEPSPQTYVVDFLASSEGLQLNRAFLRVRDPKVRRRIVDLVVSLSSQDLEGGDSSPVRQSEEIS